MRRRPRSESSRHESDNQRDPIAQVVDRIGKQGQTPRDPSADDFGHDNQSVKPYRADQPAVQRSRFVPMFEYVGPFQLSTLRPGPTMWLGDSLTAQSHRVC